MIERSDFHQFSIFNSQLSAAGGLAAVKMGKMHRKSPAALGR